MPEPRSLEPLDGWSVFFRGRFETRHGGHTWTVDVDFLDLGQKLSLYRDGARVDVRKSPARFDLGPGSTIEASMGMLGMRRIDLVADGASTTLAPADGTLEAWRLRLERDRPGLSRTIGAVSWTVLVIALVTGVGELMALAGIEPPFELPQPIDTILGFAAVLAALERALRFKSNRWLDQ
jgi:hypothetical protein